MFLFCSKIDVPVLYEHVQFQHDGQHAFLTVNKNAVLSQRMGTEQNPALQPGYKSLNMTEKRHLKNEDECNSHITQYNCPPYYMNTGSDVSESVKNFVLEDVAIRQ